MLMTTYNNTIRFTDANNNLVEISISIQNGRLSMNGEYGSSSGQCNDRIVPANDIQEALLGIWNEYHLNDCMGKELPEDITDVITILCDNIRTSNGSGVDLNSDDITQYLDEQLLALTLELDAQGFTITQELLDTATIDGMIVTLGGKNYIVGTYNQCENYAREYLYDGAYEMMGLSDIPERIREYIDIYRWVDDCINYDGLGHTLNSYDGGEVSQVVNGTDYFLYRQ